MIVDCISQSLRGLGITFLLSTLLLASCLRNETDSARFFLEKKYGLTVPPLIDEIEKTTFSPTPNYTYPKYTFVRINSLNEDFTWLISQTGAIHFEKRDTANTAAFLIDKDLYWHISDAVIGVLDIPNWWKFRLKDYANSYLAFLHENSLPRFSSGASGWNGRFLFQLHGNQCYIFIEELHDPLFETD